LTFAQLPLEKFKPSNSAPNANQRNNARPDAMDFHVGTVPRAGVYRVIAIFPEMKFMYHLHSTYNQTDARVIFRATSESTEYP